MTTPEAWTDDPDGLRRRAARYRQIASRILDPMAVEGLLELAKRYETMAAEMEARAKPATCRAHGK